MTRAPRAGLVAWRAHVSNLRGAPRVVPVDTQTPHEREAIMFSITLKRPLVTLAAIAGLLAAAGSASAQGGAPATPDVAGHGQTPAGLIAYNGHAGLGAGFAAVSDGTIELVRPPSG
jgi:hypothetical protein